MSSRAERTSGDSKTTRDRILRAAAEEFAAHGYHGVSLREILRISGANAASGHYYFRSKQQLYFETVAHSSAIVGAERAALLAAFEAQDDWRTKRLADLMRAYMGPHIRYSASEEGRAYGMIMGRLGYEPREVLSRVFDELLRPNRMRLAAMMRRMFPDVPDNVFAHGMAVAIGIMASAPLAFEHHVPPVPRVTTRTLKSVEDMAVKATTAALLALFKA